MARLATIVTLSIAVAALCARWVHLNERGAVGYAWMADEGASAFDGREVVLSLVRVVAITGEEHFRVAAGTIELDVAGPVDGVVVGADVTVVGRWDGADREVDAERIRSAPQRRSKKLLGLLGLAATVALLPMWFRVTPRGVALRG